MSQNNTTPEEHATANPGGCWDWSCRICHAPIGADPTGFQGPKIPAKETMPESQTTKGKVADFVLRGRDQFGGPTVKILRDVYIGPDFYFWLGADAYPPFSVISGIKLSGENNDT